MEETLKVLNRMEQEGVIGRYAIGGAIAASYYVEPSVTYDLDVFSVMGAEELLVDLAPIYGWLRNEGYTSRGAGVQIEDWEVQFLVPGTELVEEALRRARDVTFGETRTRIFTAEHLAMIMLEVGRPKDRARLAQFLEEEALDNEVVEEIASRHSLTEKWRHLRQSLTDQE